MCIEAVLSTGHNKELGFDSQHRREIVFFPPEARPSLGPTQPLILWMHGAVSLAVMQPGCVLTTDLHLVLRLRMHGAIPPVFHMSSWRGA